MVDEQARHSGSSEDRGTTPAAATESDRPRGLSAAPSGATEGATTAAAEEGVTPEERREAVEFDVLRNALLHTMRQRWLDSLHRWMMFLIVLSGTAGAATLTAGLIGPVAFAAATAVLATLDLVLDLRAKARVHDDLRRRYYLLLADMAEMPEADAAKVAEWQARMLRLTAEEPDLHRAVDCLAYNAALRALGRDPDHMLVIPWWRRQVAHVCTFPGYDPLQRREVTERK